jgi:hypothetical protein
VNQGKIFVAQPYDAPSRVAFGLIEQALAKGGWSILPSSRTPFVRGLAKGMEEGVASSDLVVADITGGDASVMCVLGWAGAHRKPALIIHRDEHKTSFEIKEGQRLRYSIDQPDHFMKGLERSVTLAMRNPGSFLPLPEARSCPVVFVSYSRKDVAFMERLLVHLKPLEDQKKVEVWVDTRIDAGQDWLDEIQGAAKRTRVAVLLVSADYLASEFILQHELPLLIRRSKSGAAQIIPVILDFCQFDTNPELTRFQAINDPRKPLAKLKKTQREGLYTRIAHSIARESSKW